MHLHKTNTFLVNGVKAYPEVGKLEYRDEFDEDICAMRRSITTEFKFGNTKNPARSTFTELLLLERQRDICHSIDLNIEKCCDLAIYDAFEGRINLKNGTWNCETCKFTTTIEPKDAYSCITDTWKENKNFLDIEERVTLDTLIGEVECANSSSSSFAVDSTPPDPPLPSPPAGFGWTIQRKILRVREYQDPVFNDDVTQKICTVRWCRECLDVAPPAGSQGWQQEGANWYSVVSAGSPQTNTTTELVIEADGDEGLQVWETITTTTYSIIDFEADNGITLESIIKFYNPDCCISSNFFGIDPDGTAPQNQAYSYAAQFLQDLVIFQSSDIITPNASQSAFNAGTEQIDAGDKNFCDLWSDLKKMFNLIMIYDPLTECIRIEHISYKRNRPILNLQKYADGIYLKGTGVWTYDKIDFPTLEKWKHAFDTGIKDFDGAYVRYDSNCTNGDENNCELKCIVTNIGKIYNNPDYDNDSSNQTITLVSTNNGQINSLNGSFSGTAQLNGPLSFPSLIENLHLWNRPLSGGVMNDKVYDFIATKRQRKQSISIKMCCENYFAGIFDPNMLVRTKLGLGEIISANYCDPGEKLDLEIVY